MITNTAEFENAGKSEGSGSFLTWAATILACVYVLWMGWSLFRTTSIFMDMYNSMGVDLPGSTKIVIVGHRFLFPLVFGGAIGVVIAKQFLVREKWANLCVTLMSVVMVELFGNGVVRALYQPVLDLVEKLNK